MQSLKRDTQLRVVLRGSAFSEFLTDSPEIFGTFVKVRPTPAEQNDIFPCGRVGTSSHQFRQGFVLQLLGNLLCVQRLIHVLKGRQIFVSGLEKQTSKQGCACVLRLCESAAGTEKLH